MLHDGKKDRKDYSGGKYIYIYIYIYTVRKKWMTTKTVTWIAVIERESERFHITRHFKSECLRNKLIFFFVCQH